MIKFENLFGIAVVLNADNIRQMGSDFAKGRLSDPLREAERFSDKYQAVLKKYGYQNAENFSDSYTETLMSLRRSR
jgi:hypothetical protein